MKKIQTLFIKTFSFFFVIVMSFTFIACDDDGDNNYEEQYPQEIQDEATEFCTYWKPCGTGFYYIDTEPPAWNDSFEGCKHFVYQMFDLDYYVTGMQDINSSCYRCLMERHGFYLSEEGEGIPSLDQCSLYPRECYMSTGDCRIPEDWEE